MSQCFIHLIKTYPILTFLGIIMLWGIILLLSRSDNNKSHFNINQLDSSYNNLQKAHPSSGEIKFK